MKQIALILFLTISSQSVIGQNKLSAEALIDDLNILQRNLKQVHTGLYLYTNEVELDQWFMKTKESITDSMTSLSFFHLIAPINSLIKNGHTAILPDRDNYTNTKVFPLDLYLHDNNFYIRASIDSTYEHLMGSKIESINGKSIHTTFDEMLEGCWRDGYNLGLPNAYLSYFFSERYLGHEGSFETFKIRLTTGKEYTLKAMDHTYYTQSRTPGFPRTSSSFRMLNDTIGYFDFKSFESSELRKSTGNFNRFLKEMFLELNTKETEHLIIDLRFNPGGNEKPAAKVISYLHDQTFIIEQDTKMRSRKISDHKYYHREGVFWFNHFSWLFTKKRGPNDYKTLFEEGLKEYKPKKNVYQGQIYILTNSLSFSMAGEFASFMHEYTPAIFIGEETGGNQYKNVSGQSYTLTLPHSKNLAILPNILYTMNVSKEKDNGHGVQPHHEVKNTIEDVLSGQDRVLLYTLDLIAQ